MPQTPEDFAKAAKEFLESLSTGTPPGEDAIQNFLEIQKKFNAIAIKAARDNVTLGHDWTQQTLDRMQPSDAASDLASLASKAAAHAQDQAKATQGTASAAAEIARKAQEEAWQLFLQASQDLQSEVLKQAQKSS